MKKYVTLISAVFLLIIMAASANAIDRSLAEKLNNVLVKGPAEGHWQVNADEVFSWIQARKKDFIIVDVRPNPQEYQYGHIPGALYIAYYDILKPKNLKKLPKDKKIILVCVTGQTQNLPIVPLRLLGFDARTLRFGHLSWIKGYWAVNVVNGAISHASQRNFPLEK